MFNLKMMVERIGRLLDYPKLGAGMESPDIKLNCDSFKRLRRSARLHSPVSFC